MPMKSSQVNMMIAVGKSNSLAFLQSCWPYL
jgi:hypothetical protein